jgi:hypothetical protein
MSGALHLMAPRFEQRPADANDRGQRRTRMRYVRADLFAATLAVEAPSAEVFAVVRQQPVAVFAKTRTRALHGFEAGVPGPRIGRNGNHMAGGETLERDFLDRAAMQRRAKSGVVHDLAVADVNAVVAVAGAMCDEMGAEWKLEIGRDSR